MSQAITKLPGSFPFPEKIINYLLDDLLLSDDLEWLLLLPELPELLLPGEEDFETEGLEWDTDDDRFGDDIDCLDCGIDEDRLGDEMEGLDCDTDEERFDDGVEGLEMILFEGAEAGLLTE